MTCIQFCSTSLLPLCLPLSLFLSIYLSLFRYSPCMCWIFFSHFGRSTLCSTFSPSQVSFKFCFICVSKIPLSLSLSLSLSISLPHTHTYTHTQTHTHTHIHTLPTHVNFQLFRNLLFQSG